MKKYIFLFFILASISCSNKQENEQFIARVGKSTLTFEDLSMMIPETNSLFPSNPEYINSLVTTWIKNEILYQKALEYHFDKDLRIKRRVDSYHRTLIIDAYIKYFVQTSLSINENEIRDYYKENRRSFIRDVTEAKLSHVVVKNFNEARHIKSVILSQNRKSLEKLYAQYPFEIKIVKKGDSLKEIDHTVFATPYRYILGPIATDYGYHVIRVLARYRKGSIRPIDEVRDEIIKRITQDKIQDNYNILIDSLSLATDSEINENSLQEFLITNE